MKIIDPYASSKIYYLNFDFKVACQSLEFSKTYLNSILNTRTKEQRGLHYMLTLQKTIQLQYYLSEFSYL